MKKFKFMMTILAMIAVGLYSYFYQRDSINYIYLKLIFVAVLTYILGSYLEAKTFRIITKGKYIKRHKK